MISAGTWHHCGGKLISLITVNLLIKLCAVYFIIQIYSSLYDAVMCS